MSIEEDTIKELERSFGEYNKDYQTLQNVALQPPNTLILSGENYKPSKIKHLCQNTKTFNTTKNKFKKLRSHITHIFKKPKKNLSKKPLNIPKKYNPQLLYKKCNPRVNNIYKKTVYIPTAEKKYNTNFIKEAYIYASEKVNDIFKKVGNHIPKKYSKEGNINQNYKDYFHYIKAMKNIEKVIAERDESIKTRDDLINKCYGILAINNLLRETDNYRPETSNQLEKEKI